MATSTFTQLLNSEMKVWGKWDKLFKALKICENGVGSVKVCGPQSAREELSAYQSETAFPKTKQ